jgi:HAD superfamily hydrolase (TIGR01493 family)
MSLIIRTVGPFTGMFTMLAAAVYGQQVTEVSEFKPVKVIAFDVFGTVLDFSDVDREEVREYARQLRQPVWSPLKLPRSWRKLPAHPDAVAGIAKLRENYTVVAMTNGPVDLVVEVSKHNGINWDMIIPIEMRQVYKPKPASYEIITELFGCQPEQVLMVTANPMFGDVEAAKGLGMQAVVIRQATGIADILELSEALKVTR